MIRSNSHDYRYSEKYKERKTGLSELNQLVLDGYRDGVGYEYYRKEMRKREHRRALTPRV